MEEYEHNSNSRMQQGRVLNVMEKSASNANGAANGFMGLGMMNMATGGMGNAVMQNAFNPAQTAYQPQASQAPAQQQEPVAPVEQPAPAQEPAVEETPVTNNNEVTANAENTANGWVCPTCGNTATGKFCGECGTKKPEPKADVCPNCGTKINEGAKFCGECGTKLQ